MCVALVCVLCLVCGVLCALHRCCVFVPVRVSLSDRRCLPSLDEVDGDVKSLVLALRSHPAGQFALRMFRDHRGAAVVPCLPLLQRSKL